MSVVINIIGTGSGVDGPQEYEAREEVEEVCKENAEDEDRLEDVRYVVEKWVVYRAASEGQFTLLLSGCQDARVWGEKGREGEGEEV